MNGYERISAALKGEQPDKVPIMLHNFMMAAKEAGYTQAEYRSDPKKIADSFMRAVETYQYDGILVDIDTAVMAGAVGVPVDFPENEPARCEGGCISDLAQVPDLEPADVGKDDRIRIWIESVRLLKQHFGDEIYVRGNCDQAPFSLASMMRTPQVLMMDLMDEDNRGNLETLLEYCTDAAKQFISLMADTGAHMVSNGDSPAGPEMISPDMYETFALPYERRLVEQAHSKGASYALHVCGNTAPILEHMLTTGADALELDYKTDTRTAYDICHDKTTFIGNLDPTGVIAFGTPQVVREKTLELLKVYSGSPRFVLNAGCCIPPDTPAENLMAMIETARTFVRD